MTLFIVIENYNDIESIVGVFESLDSARVKQITKQCENKQNYISYRIEEWNVE